MLHGPAVFVLFSVLDRGLFPDVKRPSSWTSWRSVPSGCSTSCRGPRRRSRTWCILDLGLILTVSPAFPALHQLASHVPHPVWPGVSHADRSLQSDVYVFSRAGPDAVQPLDLARFPRDNTRLAPADFSDEIRETFDAAGALGGGTRSTAGAMRQSVSACALRGLCEIPVATTVVRIWLPRKLRASCDSQHPTTAPSQGLIRLLCCRAAACSATAHPEARSRWTLTRSLAQLTRSLTQLTQLTHSLRYWWVTGRQDRSHRDGRWSRRALCQGVRELGFI